MKTKRSVTTKRIRTVAIIAAAVVAIGGLFVVDNPLARKAAAGEEPGEEPAARIVPVAVEETTVRAFEERLSLQGTVEAKRTALVPPRLRGTLVAVHVDEGDRVVAGETVLFESDAIAVGKRLEIARRELAVAGCSLAEKKANRDRVEADRHKATLDFRRYERLVEKGAVTRDAFERAESGFLQAEAMSRHAASLVALAAEQERLAAASLAIAEKDLTDARVVAPLSGVVSARFSEPGEYGDPMKPILRIDDLTLVEISAHIPEMHYSRIVPGKTPMRVRAGGAEMEPRPLSYRSPTIHPSLRTFEVKAFVENPPDGIVPGAPAAVDVLLARREAPGVKREAIVMRASGPVVFHVVGGAARMVRVETGLETGGYVEIRGGALPPGAAVVTMGQFLLEDGTPVEIRN